MQENFFLGGLSGSLMEFNTMGLCETFKGRKTGSPEGLKMGCTSWAKQTGCTHWYSTNKSGVERENLVFDMWIWGSLQKLTENLTKTLPLPPMWGTGKPFEVHMISQPCKAKTHTVTYIMSYAQQRQELSKKNEDIGHKPNMIWAQRFRVWQFQPYTV